MNLSYYVKRRAAENGWRFKADFVDYVFTYAKMLDRGWWMCAYGAEWRSMQELFFKLWFEGKSLDECFWALEYGTGKELEQEKRYRNTKSVFSARV